MAWFKVDDKLHSHEKAAVAGYAALGAWTLAGSWCSDHLTDGRIPVAVAHRFAPAKAWQKLIEARLLKSDGEAYVMHDFVTYNPSSDAVKAVRAEVSAKRAIAGSKGAAKRWQTDSKRIANDWQKDGPNPNPNPNPGSENPPNPPAGGTSSAGDDLVPTSPPSTLIRLTPREQAVAAALADDRTIGPIAADATALAVKLCERFPGVDLVAEIGKAGGWCRANPSKAPTKSADRFLAKWLKDKDPTVAWVVACYLAALKRFARIDRAALDGDHKAAAKVVKEAGIQVAHRAARGGGGYVPTLRDAAAHWLKTYVTLDDPKLAEQGYPLAFMLTRINVGDLPTRPVTAETNGPASAAPVQRTAPPADDATPEDIATPEQIQQLGLGAGFGNGLTSGATPILQRPRFS